jgi:hypothetical protein
MPRSLPTGQPHSNSATTVAAVRHQHVMADRDAAIARELNRLVEGG